MNFYILTFKNKIIFCFILIFLCMVIVNLLLFIMINLKSTKQTFVNNKYSKIKHYKLNSTNEKDFVFIGSSRTVYHISTNTFNKKGLDVYNLGISGLGIEDYPKLIDEIIPQKPKNVVLSVSINTLYEKLPIPKYPTFIDLKYLFIVDKKLFIESFIEYIKSFNLFLEYSETIYSKIITFYEKFNSNKKIYSDNNEINTLLNLDCKIFDLKKLANDILNIKCTNGDGILLGNNVVFDNKKTINKKTILFLKMMLDELKNSNINVILIFEPVLKCNCNYDLNLIKKEFFEYQIYDLTNFTIQESFWADDGHLNNTGRIIYSEYLSTLLKEKK